LFKRKIEFTKLSLNFVQLSTMQNNFCFQVNTVDCLKNANYPLERTLLVVDIRAYTYYAAKFYADDVTTDMTYSEVSIFKFLSYVLNMCFPKTI